MRVAIVTLAGVTNPQPAPSLVEALLRAGSEVTVLRLPAAVPVAGRPCAGALAEGAELVELDPAADSTPLIGSRPARLPYRVDRWLRSQDGRFDLVHFPLSGGTAFYAALARQQGLAYRRTVLCVWMDLPTLGRLAGRGEVPDHPDFVELDFLEQQALFRADGAIQASAEAVAWCRGERWKLPVRCLEQPPDGSPEALAAWHASLLTGSQAAPARIAVTETPRVSVCLTHFDRPNLLRQAVESLRRQNYPDFEVVLLDDGSRTTAARDLLAELEGEFARRNWQIIRQENRYLGAARNAAALAAKGEYLLFMDDDNVARPEELSVFVQAMRNSGADILTCFMDLLRGDGEPSPKTRADARVLFLGGALGPGLFRNLFGDANAFTRRTAFLARGGFTEDRGVGAEDGEYFARAALAGYRVEVIPESLFWYRIRAGSMSRGTVRADSEKRRLRPYREAVPPELQSLVDLTYVLGRRIQVEEDAAEDAESRQKQQSPPTTDKYNKS